MALNNPERAVNTHSVLDSSMIGSIGSLVHHSFLHSNCKPRWITQHIQVIPPAVTPPPISFMALIVTQDIYKDNEILIFKGADFSGNPFRPNNEPNSTRYKTYQYNSVLKNCSIRPYILFLLILLYTMEDIGVKGMIDKHY